MKKAIFILLLCNSIIYAQDSIRITGHLKNNTKFAKVVIKRFGIGSFDIAAVPIKDEKFSIVTPLNLDTGVYRLQYSQSSLNGYVDVILDGKEKNIDFDLDLSKPKSFPVFKQSIENKKWYDYQNQANKILEKINLLSQFINQFPDKTSLIFNQTKVAYEKEKSVYKSNLQKFLSENKNSWAGEMIANKPVYFSNPTDMIKIQDYYHRNNFWNNINTNKPKLINTPLYFEHILNYMQYYMNPEMNFGEEEANIGFKKSIDTVMQKFGKNEETKKFALKYLQLGFKEIGNENVLQYIDTKHKDLLEQCNTDIEKTEFENRIKCYEALKIGAQAPEIFFNDKTGKIISLKNLSNNKIILAFWASWCPNCESQMPKLNEFIKTNPEYGAVAISLDDDINTYIEVIKKYPEIYHSCDFKKWKGKTVNDYCIYGSPTFMILDNERKILGKYPSWEATIQALENK